MNQPVKEWTVELHWKDGKVNVGKGYGVTSQAAAADAANRMGFGAGAIAALDYWDAEVLNEPE